MKTRRGFLGAVGALFGAAVPAAAAKGSEHFYGTDRVSEHPEGEHCADWPSQDLGMVATGVDTGTAYGTQVGYVADMRLMRCMRCGTLWAKRLLAMLALALLAAPAAAQPVYNSSGEQRNVCKVWDGTDTADVTAAGRVLVDGSGVTQPVSGTVTVTDGSGALNTIVDSGTLTCNAGSGTFVVGDGAGALNVIVDSGTVAATQSGTWTVQPGNTANTTPWLTSIHDGTTKASVHDLTNSNPLDVAIVDGSGTQITSFGGGTQYTEGDTDASITGTALLWEDTSDTLRAASAAKPFPVTIISGPAGGDGKILDGAGANEADVENAALASSTLEGLVVRPYPPGDGTLTSTIRDTGSADSLNVAIVDAAGNQVTSFGGGTQYAEDTVLASGEQITMAGVIRDNTPASLVDADGDRTELQVDGTGLLWVNGSGVTQPISAASLPLPTGAATAANQDGIVRDGTGDTTQANVSSGRVHVDGSGVTQPVSGTVTVTATDLDIRNLNVTDDIVQARGAAADGAAVAGNPNRIAGKDGSGNTQDIITDTSGELQVDVLTLPSVTIGTFPDNEPFNVAQINGVTPLMGNGASGTGAQRVTIASDSTGQIAIASFPDNEPVNMAQMNGVAVTMGNGTSGTGVQRVTIASDSTGQVAVASFPDNEPVNVAQKGGSAVAAGPCEREVPLYAQVDQTSGEQIVTGTSSERVYICSIAIVTATAQNIALVDGTGSVCATSPTGLLGGSTAATGQNYAANGGWVLPFNPGGWAKTSTDADNVCLLQSGGGQVSGIVTYVSVPNI